MGISKKNEKNVRERRRLKKKLEKIIEYNASKERKEEKYRSREVEVSSLLTDSD